VTDKQSEVSYYRAVEDLFAKLRGVPHLLSSKDFQILRGWWRDAVPLEAVTAGVTEIMTRKRLEDESDPVVSLGYCRHAVLRHAKRLAAARVGESAQGEPEPDREHQKKMVDAIVQRLHAAADRHDELSPGVSAAIRDAARLAEAASTLSPGAADEHLYNVEAQLLADCLAAILPDQREELLQSAQREALASGATGAAAKRAAAAFRDRQLRQILDLPRLELST